jgi:peptidyl-prolyl cis-trans isomerase B (cyclophilin B)
MRLLRPCALLLLVLPSSLPATQDPVRVRQGILAAEDQRPATREGLAPIITGLASPDSVARRLAVRALGRQEREDLLDLIGPMLGDSLPGIRAEAANAVAQAASRGDGDLARSLLQDRLQFETDPAERGALLRSLGRLPLADSATRVSVELALIRGTRRVSNDADPVTVAGAAHGLASLYRRTASRMAPSADALERLVELTQSTRPLEVRRLAMAAFVASGRTDSGALLDALRDDDREVRRLAVSATSAQANLLGRERIIRRAWNDPDPGVRLEALRGYGRRLMARDGCAPVAQAIQDLDPQVQLLAIDLLAGCGQAASGLLLAITQEEVTPAFWHRPAHALVALSAVAPEVAADRLPAFLRSPVGWVRTYAARAATMVKDAAALEPLLSDQEANVREAALAGLARLRGHGADPSAIAALSDRDYQVLMTAAAALDSTPDPAPALSALFASLKRVTAERRETSRDPRMAMLTVIGSIGSAADAPALRPWLADFDPAIAGKAAGILSTWTGALIAATPAPLKHVPVPSWGELDRMARLSPVLVMADGGRIRLRLFPFEAPTNTARFVRMARSGWFNGLTFHRVVANFVVQGGSPDANEYMGDGPFTRDELTLRSHTRGTLGVSTRGRDTGDGQIFINLVDNIRLDHDYTIIAEVISGMDAVDALLEGAVIARVEFEGGGGE